MKNPQDDGLVITMMISRSAEAGALPDPEPVADPNPEADAHYGYYGYGEDDHDAHFGYYGTIMMTLITLDAIVTAMRM